jgi:hypothetical protein
LGSVFSHFFCPIPYKKNTPLTPSPHSPSPTSTPIHLLTLTHCEGASLKMRQKCEERDRGSCVWHPTSAIALCECGGVRCAVCVQLSDCASVCVAEDGSDAAVREVAQTPTQGSDELLVRERTRGAAHYILNK